METIRQYYREVKEMLEDLSLTQIREVLYILENAYHTGKRIFIMGNGGSAATASHFALDLAKNTITAGVPRVKAISLTDHVPLITAWSNDTAYENIFSEQLAVMIEPGDVVIGISASGNSQNVINALLLAKETRAYTVGLLGGSGGRMKDLVDAYVLTPGKNIEQEEDGHMILTHIITRHMRQIVHTYKQQQIFLTNDAMLQTNPKVISSTVI